MKRAILGGVLAGLVLFAWSFVAHDLLPLGTAGLRTLEPAQEQAVLAALGGALHERALYLFPKPPTGQSTADEQKAWLARYAAGPAAIVAYNPRPADRAPPDALFPLVFATELLGDVLAALVAALLITHLPAGLGLLRRALLVGSLGLIMTLDVDVSYWNWYAFPASYTLAQLADHGLGWCLAGLVLARVCR